MNKVPTYDNLQKWAKQEPGTCIFCREDEENVIHLLIKCPYVIQQLTVVDQITSFKKCWEGDSVEQCFKKWSDKKELKEWKVVPYLTCKRVWIAQNQMLFEEKGIPSFQQASQAQALAWAYNMFVSQKIERHMIDLRINKEQA